VRALWFAFFVVGTLAAQPALSRGDASAPALAYLGAPEASSFEDSKARSLIEQIDSLIQMRVTMMDRMAPYPASDAVDPALIARRLAALQELDAFLRQTVTGLTGAAPSNETRIALGEMLVPMLDKHERTITAAFAALLEHPLVRSEGWFVISRFGAEADRNAGALMRSTSIDRAFQGRVLAKLRELAPRGETGPDVVQLVSESVSR
jgi:hypothetical protein